MGQSGKSPRVTQTRENSRPPEDDNIVVSYFVTELGWIGIWGVAGKVTSLSFGHTTCNEVRQAGERLAAQRGTSTHWKERDWNKSLRRRVERFASGDVVEFSEFAISLPPQTDFQMRVIAATRRVKYGKTVTYGGLAELAGNPGAARAVGSVMASNRIPIIVPCHRVVASADKLGGYSAPRGVQLKQQLLDMEAQGICLT